MNMNGLRKLNGFIRQIGSLVIFVCLLSCNNSVFSPNDFWSKAERLDPDDRLNLVDTLWVSNGECYLIRVRRLKQNSCYYVKYGSFYKWNGEFGFQTNIRLTLPGELVPYNPTGKLHNRSTLTYLSQWVNCISAGR